MSEPYPTSRPRGRGGDMKFSFTPRGVAGVFLRQRAGSCCVERDVDDLGNIIEDAWKQGIYTAIEMAKHEYSKLHPGGCRMLSQGDACCCFLCVMDDAASKAREGA